MSDSLFFILLITVPSLAVMIMGIIAAWRERH
jgi:hypothetical protein